MSTYAEAGEDMGELAARAAQGDARATDGLLARVRQMVHRYCRARLGRLPGSEHAADDVAQEVCIAVLKALPRYRDEGRPFEAFVFGIAAHKIADVASRHVPRPRPDAEGLPPLTERELQVLRGMGRGRSNSEIGKELYLSEDTVTTHARRLFRKLGAADRAQAVAMGFRWGLVR